MVKLTKEVKLKPYHCLKISCKGNNPLNTKWVNVILEPTGEADAEDNYTVPGYSFLKSNS